MPGVEQQSYPLPDDPVLAEAAAALREAGHWAWVVDAHQRLVFVTDELRRTFGGLVELAPFAIGKHVFGPEAVRASQLWRLGGNTIELQRRFFAGMGGVILTDTPGGHDVLREIVDPALRDIVDDLSPEDPAMLSFFSAGMAVHGPVDIPIIVFRIRDHDGELVGTVLIWKPAAGMATIATMTSMGDLHHFERMRRVAQAARRPAAILFADLEASSMLGRSLSTASYFALGRRLVRAADQCVVDHGGLVGRHVGDGVVAFFLAEQIGSESTAALACIQAAHARVRRPEMSPSAVSWRLTTSYCASAFIGDRPSTSATSRQRAEPRSPRSATKSTKQPASKPARPEGVRSPRRNSSSGLIQTTRPPLASTRTAPTYTRLSELNTATDKARRDAPAIVVYDVGGG